MNQVKRQALLFLDHPVLFLRMNLRRFGSSRREGYLQSQQVFMQYIESHGGFGVVESKIFTFSNRLTRETINSSDSTKSQFRALMDKHGSDKGTGHGYDLIYDRLIPSPGQIDLLVEVGIGTNDPEAPSSMGIQGTPGASTRAFLEWGVGRVWALDIDRGALSQCQDLDVDYVDQQRPRTFRPIQHRMAAAGGADVIVVDGLHTFEADANSLLALLPYLKVGGLFVVEDIEKDETILDLWRQLLRSCSAAFETELHEMRHGHVLTINRLA